MNRTTLAALLILVLSVTGALAKGSNYIGSERATVNITARVIDTHKELILPKEGGTPYFFIGSVTLAIETWSGTGPPGANSSALPPVFVSYLRQMKDKMRVTMNYPDAEPVLKKHRKAMGFGVHGPLILQGKLHLSFDKYEDRTKMVAMAEPMTISGPKGSWTALE